jgi:chemosensory pili system protein ChpA (sensor histidine kinase/response regulator)
MLREQVNPYAPVSWVREDLDGLLGQVSNALEASAENRDTTLLAPLLNQLAGVLEILNTRGGVVAVQELEASWKAYKRGAVENQERALSSMMQTSVVLGLYLDRLESGHKDHPLLLLPAMNDLRAARGESLLSEGSLFEPDLSLDLPPVIACHCNSQKTPQQLETEKTVGGARRRVR